jgi:ribosomal protein S18 acetylase RimI-like enzyme
MKYDISIRRATESDIKTIQQFGFELLDFERKNWDPSLDTKWPFSKEGEEKYLSAIKNKYTIVAEKDGEPVGYLIGKIIDISPDSARPIKQAYLENIYVSESLRGANIGSEIFANFKDFCKKEGVSRINVSVLAANENAVEFYKNSGFSPRSINLSQEI